MGTLMDSASQGFDLELNRRNVPNTGASLEAELKKAFRASKRCLWAVCWLFLDVSGHSFFFPHLSGEGF
jgi:hypothetical protein